MIHKIIFLLIHFILFSVYPFTESQFILPKILTLHVSFFILSSIYLFQNIKNKYSLKLQIKNKSFQWLSKIIFLYIISLITSTLLSQYPLTAWWGSYLRYDGLWTFTTLILFTILIFRIIKNKYEILLCSIVSSGTILSIIGIIQYLFFNDIFHQDSNRIISTIGQPNILAQLLLLTIPITFYLYKKHKHKVLIIFCILTQCIGVLLTHSRSAFIALFVVFIFYIITQYWSTIKKHKNFIIINVLIILSLLIASGYYLSNNNSIPRSETIMSRLELWKGALNFSQENILFGVGRDVIQNNYSKHLDVKLNLLENSHNVTDRSHNIFLDILLSQGIVGLIIFILFLIQILHIYIKSKNPLQKMIFISFAAYFTMLLFNFSTLTDRFIFFILLGIFLQPIFKITTVSSTSKKQIISIIIVVIYSILSLFFSIQFFQANQSLYRGMKTTSIKYGINALEKSPSKGMYAYMASKILRKELQSKSSLPGVDVENYTDRINEYLEICFAEFPQTYYCHLSQARWNQTLAVIKNNPSYYKKAMESFHKTLEENPILNLVNYELGLTFYQIGNCKEAIKYETIYISREKNPLQESKDILKECK